jgi:hypothetical protein
VRVAVARAALAATEEVRAALKCPHDTHSTGLLGKHFAI